MGDALSGGGELNCVHSGVYSGHIRIIYMYVMYMYVYMKVTTHQKPSWKHFLCFLSPPLELCRVHYLGCLVVERQLYTMQD